jgi:K+-sensing histidine kinase KdpD
VNEWIEEALELRRCALRHQQIEVIKDYSSPLPLVSVDGVHLQKALLNLIFKAEEALALREEGRRLVLKTGFEPRNQTVSITMAANGVGMDFIRLAGPLDVWSEVESTELENHFVLREAKQWIEIMGGALTLETDLAEGPVFIIRLPVKGQD